LNAAQKRKVVPEIIDADQGNVLAETCTGGMIDLVSYGAAVVFFGWFSVI